MRLKLGVCFSAISFLVSGAVDAQSTEHTEFDPSTQTELSEALKFLDVSQDESWMISDVKRDGVYPHRCVRDLESSNGTKLVVDSTTFQILHFQRAHGPDLAEKEPKYLTEEAARTIVEETITQLAPQAEVGSFNSRFIPFSDRVAEWTRFYEFRVEQKYHGFRSRSIWITVSAITGRVTAYTNLVPIPPKNLDHTIADAEAQRLANEWISKNIGPALKIASVTEPSLELVITQEDHKRRNEADIWSRLAWVIIIKFANIPPGFRDACHVYFDPVTGDVIESGYEMIGKTL